MRKLSNRRKNPRYACTVPVESKKGTAFEGTQTINISKSGIGFVAERSIPRTKKIAMEIILAPGGDPVLVVGRVQWIRRVNGSKRYKVGMNFADMPYGSKSRLTRYFRQQFS